DRAAEALGVVEALVNRDETIGRVSMIGNRCENLLVGACCAIWLPLLRHPQFGHFEQHTDPLFVVSRSRLVALQNANELIPTIGLRVEQLELVPLAERDVSLLELFLVATII